MYKYKGYAGLVEYDDEIGFFHGEVIDIENVITFQGQCVEELERAFRESIDDYLEFCVERNEEPDKPFSGRLMLRLPTALHRKVYATALKEGKSLNQWISERLEKAG
jgi:predicted HicB family RNase H-like nuclease